jgi:hypothetical protein
MKPQAAKNLGSVEDAGKVARYTARPCVQTSSDRPIHVILIPPCTDLACGFEMAQRRISTGQTIRLVGVGVTLQRTWPAWVYGTPGLWLTELTAYRNTTRWEATKLLRASLRSLADELFDGALSDLRGSDVFYPHIGLRAFAGLAFFMPTALGFTEHHARDLVTCTRPNWPGFGLYRALAGLGPTRRRRAIWVGQVALLAAVGWAASLLHVFAIYFASRAGAEELRHRESRGPVSLWLQLFPDAPRVNDALIKATEGREVGALLHGHLGPGGRHEARLSARRGSELWPGLRSLDSATVMAWEPTSIPATFGLLARSCAQFTKHCAVSTVRLCRHGPLLDMGSYHLDMTAHARDLVKLLTIDMARVCMADAATREITRNHDFRGSTAISAGALASDVAVVMRRLGRAGATTVDFAHGWSGEPAPFTDEPPCQQRCVWAHTDIGYGDVRFVVGGMTVPPRLPRRPRESRVRVLLMSNYVHRDDTVYQTGLDGYQDELLDVIRHRSQRYTFRWRPHPADLPQAVSRAAEGLDADVSRGRPLADDLAWADVVVSTVSTATLQAVLLDLPVLIHITPDVEGLPLALSFSAERTFFFAQDGIEKLDRIVNTLDDPNLLAPERREQTVFFGEAQTPCTLAQAIESIRGRPARRANTLAQHWK